jgi:putative ABC transport system ATP-binding protein
MTQHNGYGQALRYAGPQYQQPRSQYPQPQQQWGAPAGHPGPRQAAPGAAAVRAYELVKTFGDGAAAVTALNHVSVEFPAHEFTAIMGPSGSGKSTLLHCLAGLEDVDGGQIVIGDAEITAMSDRQLTVLRRDTIGVVFQAFNLLPTLTAIDNIMLPLKIAGRRQDPNWVQQVVHAVGLADRLGHRPAQLSGGQQQRVAVARALATRPVVVFADEPTGNLDSAASAEVLEFMRGSVRELGQTIVMVTHDPLAASYSDRVLFLADGYLVGQLSQPRVETVLDALKQLGG